MCLNQKLLKEILLDVHELLDVKYATTECGGDYGYVEIEGEGVCDQCKHRWRCLESYQRRNKGAELLAKIEQLSQPTLCACRTLKNE